MLLLLGSLIAGRLPDRNSETYLRQIVAIKNLAAGLDAGPKVHLIQVWHERTNADPLQRWLRRLVLSSAEAG